MIRSERKIETLEESCELKNVLKRVYDSAASRCRELFEDVSFFPSCCLWRCFSPITHEALWNPLNTVLLSTTHVSLSYTFPTFEHCCSISQQT